MDASIVARLAALAELDLEPEEAESLARDLQRILAHVEEFAGLELDGVPADGGTGVGAALRADEHRPGLSREDALRAAPRADDGAFRVPGFVDEG